MTLLPIDGEVHVWIWDCPSVLPTIDMMSLSEDERARAGRFYFEHDRVRFIAAHLGLRQVLSSLLGIKPANVVLSTDAAGKPCLAGSFKPQLHFNLSHSHELAAVAVSPTFAVGLDIEFIRPIAFDDVTRFFADAERRTLAEMPVDVRQVGVFHCWTRKEAMTKAIGLGLSMPLDSFNVSVAPDVPARLLRMGDQPDEAKHWQLAHLIPEPGYVGAVAARALGWRLSLHRLTLSNPAGPCGRMSA